MASSKLLSNSCILQYSALIVQNLLPLLLIQFKPRRHQFYPREKLARKTLSGHIIGAIGSWFVDIREGNLSYLQLYIKARL